MQRQTNNYMLEEAQVMISNSTYSSSLPSSRDYSVSYAHEGTMTAVTAARFEAVAWLSDESE
jgi:hypothetical protein